MKNARMAFPSPAAIRLRDLRQHRNADPRELAKAAGIGIATYLNLEDSDRLTTRLTLYKLTLLAKALAIEPRQLSSNDGPPVTSSATAFVQLAHAVRTALKATGGSQEAFERQIGWKLGDFLARPEAAWAWTVEGLQFVCRSVGLDWLAVLPTTAQLPDATQT